MFGQNSTERMERSRVRRFSIRAIALVVAVLTAGLLALPAPAQASSRYVLQDTYTSFGGVDIGLPTGIAMDDDGKIYVSDDSNDRIVIYNADWTESGEIPLWLPSLLVIRNQVLYAVSGGVDIYRFDMNNNFEQIGDKYNVASFDGSPVEGMTVDSKGNIYINTLQRMGRINPSGNLSVLVKYSDIGSYDGRGMTVDEEDRLFVLTNNGYIHRWDQNGTYLGRWNYMDRFVWGGIYPYKFGLDYQSGTLVVTAHSDTSRGFFTVSAATGELIDVFREDLSFMAMDALIHPVTKQIYVLYANVNHPSGVWVYKDMGTTVTVTATSSAITVGEAVTIHVTVTANNGESTPTGTVEIKDGETKLGEVNLSGGTASFTVSDLAVGTRSIRAVYSGGGGYVGSTSAPLAIEVVKAASTTVLQTSSASITWGDSVTLTATVSGVGPGGAEPTGNVFFVSGESLLGIAAISGGEASVTVDDFVVGSHGITAQYSGDAIFESSIGTAALTVHPAASATTVSASEESVVYGQQTVLAAAVSAVGVDGTPTGNVVFKKDALTLGSSVLVDGAASLAIDSLPVGMHVITAEYEGDASFEGSSNSIVIEVEQADTATSVTASKETSVYGETVTFTAEVEAVAPGAGTPTGNVVFKNGENLLGTVALGGGTASLAVSNLTVDTHTIAAEYIGDDSFRVSSNTIQHTVEKAATTMSVATSGTSVYGEPVTITAVVAATAPGAGMPSGSVVFKNGTDVLDTVALSGGSASLDMSDLEVGTHTITAEYTGDGSFEASSGTVQQTVDKIGTTVTVTASQGEAVFGEAVSLTAAVAPASAAGGTPVGSVTFNIPGLENVTKELVDGEAVLSGITGLAVGTHVITAEYAGAELFEASSGTAQQVVNKADTTTTVVSLNEPTVYGQPATFTAAVTVVAPGAGTPTGMVEFMIGSDSLGTAPMNDGEASLVVSHLAVGTHTIDAVYRGDESFAVSSHTVLQTVEKAATTTSVTASENSVYGETVTFTVSVTAVAPGAGTPTGDVVFKNGTDVLGTVVLSGGSASLDISNLAVGTHVISAEYSGDSSFRPSEDAVSQTVNEASTTTSLITSNHSVAYGEKVTFTAEVRPTAPGAGIPTGTVTFWNGSDKLGEAPLVSGTATIDVDHLEVGTFTIEALYSGDISFKGSSGTVQQTVGKIETTLMVAASPGTTVFGESVNFTATVTPASAAGGTPVGKVIFKIAGTEIGEKELVDGEAMLSGITSLAVGTHVVTAEYAGADLFGASSGTVQHIVNLADTTTTVVSSDGPTVFGQPVTLTAAVTVIPPGAGTPTGHVEFLIGSKSLGTVPLHGGEASLAISDLAVGTHTITAQYHSDGSFAASQGTVHHTVDPADTIIHIESSTPISVYGQPVTVTATVSAATPGAGTPTGIVKFMIDGVEKGSVNLIGGTASLDVSGLNVGIYDISAEYSGDGSFNSGSNRFDQIVDKAGTTTRLVTSNDNVAYGEKVTFTAEVQPAAPGAGVPTGTVTFWNGSDKLGEVPLVGGTATIDADDLEVGTFTIEAVYSGDVSFAGSSGTVSQNVGKTGSAVDVVLSKGTIVFGEGVTFTVTVTAAVYGNDQPSGTIKLVQGADTIGTGTLDNSSVTMSVYSLPVGSHSIDVLYSGDRSYASGKQTVHVTVNKADTAANATVTNATSVFGETLTVTVDIDAVSPGAGTPTGTLTLYDGLSTVGTGTLAEGRAVIEVTDLPVGTHLIAVEYEGDSSFEPSGSHVAVQVDKAQTAAVVTANSVQVVRGREIVLTAQISAVAPGAGVPAGKVTFYDQEGVIGEVTLQPADNGTVKLVFAQGWEAGRYEVYAVYEGDSRFRGSQSAAIAITVNTPPPPPPASVVPSTPGPVESTTGEIVIPPGGSGKVSLGDAVTVTIPEGMSEAELRVTIEEVTELAGLDVAPETLVSSVYEILANLEGTFNQELVLTFVFDASRLKPGQTAAVFYFDEIHREWVEVGGVVEGNSVSVRVDHLTKFAVFAVEKDKTPSEPAENVAYTDTHGHWGEATILQAAARGWVRGYPDGTFRPDHPITRAEFIVLLANVLNLQGAHSAQDMFADDAKIGSWAKPAVYAARQAGIVAGYDDGTFRPDDRITRAEMAVIAAKALGLQLEPVTATAFADDHDIPQWAKGAAEAVRLAGIISGRGDNRMAPDANATRAEAVSILMRAMER